MAVVIKVENISKQYRLGSVGTGSLAHDLNRTWHRVRGKEDPYLKIGETNNRTLKGGSDYVWALQDINFEVKQGEVLGIIGRNGAGKSTLLKILSRTTSPSTGSVKIKGRVASLLEVGTGFHPELSGRENVFLNGAILGMTKLEIKNKFDEIVDFAGVERYIDTPVKRYSSGMYVRLAFGVAAHLEPEILIVDEVLAVGDAEFQKKALGKMKEVSTSQGRTVLFVSHNMTAVSKLCNTGLLMHNGRVAFSGAINNVVDKYFQNNTAGINDQNWDIEDAPGNELVKVLGAAIIAGKEVITTADAFSCKFKILCIKPLRFNFSLVLKNSLGDVVFNSISVVRELEAGIEYSGDLHIPSDLLNDGLYSIDLYCVDNANLKAMFNIADVLSFEVKDERKSDWIGKWTGIVRPKLKFDIA